MFKNFVNMKGSYFHSLNMEQFFLLILIPPKFTRVVTAPFTKRATLNHPILLADGKPFLSFNDNINQTLVQ